tara:strand:- start:7 stop:996 length:990 start_codon:yes stop_codon:yes gene_type:complete
MVEVYRGDLAGSYTVENDKITEDGVEVTRDLQYYLNKGYTTDSSVQDTNFGGGSNVQDQSQDPSRTLNEGIQQANLLFQFMPESVRNEFAKQWIEYGDTALAQSATRQTAAWDKEFGYLKRDDGSFIMSELEAVTAKAAYRETLGEIGIADTSEFENQFEALIKGEVSADEFQQRIDTVWGAVKNNIPQVEQLFRETYNINSDTPTIFAALINPDIQDKLLRGDLETIAIGAEARAAGFNRSFTRFESLRKAGLTQDKARQVYQQGSTFESLGRQTGTGFDIATAEAAAIGDMDAQRQLGLLAAEGASMSSVQTGAAKKDGKVSGLLES